MIANLEQTLIQKIHILPPEKQVKVLEFVEKIEVEVSAIDLIDAVIVAIAERLEIIKILTVDRRHFSVFKPVHCKSFTLLPNL